MKIRVHGTPIPQGSTKAFALKKDGAYSGRVAVTSDNPQTRPWRNAIVAEWRAAALEARPAALPGTSCALAGPVAVTVTFWMPRPKHHYGAGRNAAVVRPSAPPRPIGKPDLDKLCRAVLDALSDAGAWQDDSQVCDLWATKEYATADELPGAEIQVDPINGTWSDGK